MKTATRQLVQLLMLTRSDVRCSPWLMNQKTTVGEECGPRPVELTTIRGRRIALTKKEAMQGYKRGMIDRRRT
ncbi:hypothetical protein BJX99DRAFT_221241 [Aspergillus californicus]